MGGPGETRPTAPTRSRGCRRRAVQRSACGTKAPGMQKPLPAAVVVARGVPGPRPYLWPTSLPTEPPPRAGSSGLSPCGSSGAEAPAAGAPPGPALPSDGERGSLARAILRERTAAAAAAAGGGSYHRSTTPRPPRAAAAVELPGVGGLGSWGEAPPLQAGERRRGGRPGRPRFNTLLHPRRPGVPRMPLGEGGLRARGCLGPPYNGRSSNNHDTQGLEGREGEWCGDSWWLLATHLCRQDCWRGREPLGLGHVPDQPPVGPADPGGAQDLLTAQPQPGWVSPPLLPSGTLPSVGPPPTDTRGPTFPPCLPAKLPGSPPGSVSARGPRLGPCFVDAGRLWDGPCPARCTQTPARGADFCLFCTKWGN